MIKKMKEKFWTWADSEKGERVVDAAVVAVGYGLGLLMITDLILMIVNFVICPFSKNTVMALSNLLRKFNLL